MDWLKGKLQIITKYKYVVIVILVGALLMFLPTAKKKEEPQPAVQTTEEDDEQQLKRILQTVSGVGRVDVYLKKERGEQYVYQTDIDSNTAADRSDQNISTILITDSSRNQSGLIQTVIMPKYAGAVIVCQGADDPQIKLFIVDAVSKVTGLGSDKISVLKMK